IGEVIHAYSRSPPAKAAIRAAWERRDLVQLPSAFFGRILTVDQRTAEYWAMLRGAAGAALCTEDALLLATARAHGHAYVGPRPPGTGQLDVACVDPHALAVGGDR
ncbi:MAG: hypothetical protein KDK91_29320, partial [Gammaproteobacteria bacterium]|nr:hypothetical protein [Gammaproteobacteria bacterium]